MGLVRRALHIIASELMAAGDIPIYDAPAVEEMEYAVFAVGSGPNQNPSKLQTPTNNTS